MSSRTALGTSPQTPFCCLGLYNPNHVIPAKAGIQSSIRYNYVSKFIRASCATIFFKNHLIS